jgi:hypothetical protein
LIVKGGGIADFIDETIMRGDADAESVGFGACQFGM